jgi:hypothetical protein
MVIKLNHILKIYNRNSNSLGFSESFALIYELMQMYENLMLDNTQYLFNSLKDIQLLLFLVGVLLSILIILIVGNLIVKKLH